jgi:hypothetical protein
VIISAHQAAVLRVWVAALLFHRSAVRRCVDGRGTMRPWESSGACSKKL